MTNVQLHPLDEHNQRLVAHAHPADWKNPTPAGDYNLVAIGGGTAGIISALIAAGLGGRAALIERHLLGGDCLNYGCVPSKALIRAARAAHQVRTAGDFGVEAPGVKVDFAGVMERMRRLRAQISHHDSAQRFASLGVDVFLGQARFSGPQSLQVGEQELRFRRCVIATGARAAKPSIPGIDEAGYLTNETLFSLTKLPSRLAVIGGGPIGAEMAQTFRRFGSEVYVIEKGARLLARDDPAASQVVKQQFEREGIHLHTDATVERVEGHNGARRLFLQRNGQQHQIDVDEILVAIGRTPNVEGLDLEAAGVEFGPRGVRVDDRLRTTNSRIFAAGDIAGSYQFTHAADAMARVCVQNAFFFGRRRLSGLVIPHATYTDPEVAHVGLTPQQADQQGVAIDSYREDLRNVDRAILDGEEAGFAVVHCRRGSGWIVGATIVGAHAAEMIGELSLMLTQRIKLGALGGVVHCYPTQVEVLKRIGDQFNKQKLTPLVARLLKRILTFRR